MRNPSLKKQQAGIPFKYDQSEEMLISKCEQRSYFFKFNICIFFITDVLVPIWDDIRNYNSRQTKTLSLQSKYMLCHFFEY